MPSRHKPDPYNGFKNDSERRRALLAKEIRVGVVTVVCCIVLALGGVRVTPESFPQLLTVLHLPR